jgi:small-conductance mechanosensitive channel
MNFITSLNTQMILTAVGVLVGARLASAIIMFVLKRAKFLTAKTKTTLDDTVISLLARPIHFGFQLGAIVFVLYYLFPAFQYQGFDYQDLGFVFSAFWVGYLINRIVIGVLSWHQTGGDDSEGKTFGFLNTLVSTLVYGLALAFVLNYAGVDISALLAGLGIAGLAVALALQNTLSGVFSAVYLALDKPIKQGDYISLEDGTEGFVDDISMRSTRIKTFSNTIVIVPNSKLTDMVMTNYYLPGKSIVLKVPVGISYDADLNKAEEIAIKTADKVLESLDVKGKKETFVRFGEFGDSAIKMTIFLNVKTFLDQFLVRHEFIKELTMEYKKAKIEIPFAQMDVHVKK